ncbi:unnamed protein product [Chironomus riparius]|uniref:N-acetyltransferase domain-containing protein n=1 Tax=Chironomus riparius TaxID=315576 RepID=A0A9N9RYE9_9DIPT|nr:unnamed protein product [Chironomus riparius]
MKTKLKVFPRQDGISYPQIYRKFKAKSRNIDEIVNEEEFYIQDLTENYFDDAVDFMIEYHARSSIFHRAAGTLLSDDGVERIRQMYRKVFEENISLICLKADTNEIIGVNAITIRSKDDEPSVPSDDPKFQILYDAKEFIEHAFNIMDYYDVDRFMFTAGLCVHKKHRCKGIATEILKARAPLMKTIDVNVTASIFSTIGAQNAATSAGFTHHYSILYEDLEKLFNGMNFSHAYGNSCKLSAFKISD